MQFNDLTARPRVWDEYQMPRLFIRTVGVASAGAYAWAEQYQNNPGVFENDPNGLSGSPTDSPAFMADGSAGVPIGTICEAVQHYGGWLIAWPITSCVCESIPVGSGSGSGSGDDGDCLCSTRWDDGLSYCTTFPGVTDYHCGDCSLLSDTIEMIPAGIPCRWQARVFICGSDGLTLPALVTFDTSGSVKTILVSGGASEASYASGPLPDWDCITPITLNRVFPADSGPGWMMACENWPATITVQPCAGDAAPTVTQSTANICRDATTLTITGTNFVSPASNNTVNLRDSASNAIAHTVASGTAISLTLTLTTPPIAVAGAVTAIVTNANGNSGAAVQVATVEAVPSITNLGTATTAGAEATSLTKTVTALDGLLVVVVNAVSASLSNPTLSATFNGVAMTLDKEQGVSGFSGMGGKIAVFSLEVAAGTHDIVATSSISEHLQIQAYSVPGVSIADKNASNAGLASAPDTGATATTTSTHEAVFGFFNLIAPGAAHTWTNGFATTSQDVTDTYSAVSIVLTGGKQLPTATGTFQAALTGVTPVKWNGITITYKCQ